MAETRAGAIPADDLRGRFAANVARIVELVAAARGLTIADVGTATGLGRGAIDARLKGVTEWSALEIARLARVLQVQPEVFYPPLSDLLFSDGPRD